MAKKKRSQRGKGSGTPKVPEIVPARLMLATPPRFDPATLAGRLDAAMSEADVACLVIDLEPEADVAAWEEALAALLPIAQRRECAVLTTGRFDLIERRVDPRALDDAESVQFGLPVTGHDDFSGVHLSGAV